MSRRPPITAVAVGVPAFDEADTIGACLDALVRSARAAATRVHLVVAADSCTDATASIAHERLARLRGLVTGAVVHTSVRRAGAARNVACLEALATLRQPSRTAWLATTDADSTVPPGWLGGHLRWARHVDGIAGLVRVEDWSEHPPATRSRFERELARHGTGIGHGHVFGANLGMRADRWLSVGGFRALDHGEDHDLWRHARTAGARLLGVPDITVTTSARRAGRAPLGFARALIELAEPSLA